MTLVSPRVVQRGRNPNRATEESLPNTSKPGGERGALRGELFVDSKGLRLREVRRATQGHLARGRAWDRDAHAKL